jgi:hypothetical protein
MNTYIKHLHRDADKCTNKQTIYTNIQKPSIQHLQRDADKAQKDSELSKFDMRVVMEGEALLKQRIRALEDEVDTRDGKDRQVSA